MKEIQLNAQQIELIKGFCLEILDEKEGSGVWSNTTKSVATQILAKINEE